MKFATKLSEFLSVVLASLGMGAVAWAQSAPPPPPGQGQIMEFSFVGMERSFDGKVVKGAPYSAQTSSETNQTLADGTHISRKTTGAVFRDSAGRTRRETTLSAIVPLAAAGVPPRMVVIHDAVSGSKYVLDPDQKTAHVMNSHGGHFAGGGPGGRHFKPGWPEPQTESLGTETIEGFAAEGTRTTIIIPVGQIGNDRPIVVVSERWYSPELQTVVMSKHSDPRMGETIFRLTNIVRSEPAAALFSVPADYTVTQGPDFPEAKFMKRLPPPDALPPGEED
jgi:hypothetical protein